MKFIYILVDRARVYYLINRKVKNKNQKTKNKKTEKCTG